MNITWVSWLASAICFAGNFVLIKTKSWKAFVMFFVANSLFVFYWTIRHEWATLILVSFFLLQNVLGIIEWRKKK